VSFVVVTKIFDDENNHPTANIDARKRRAILMTGRTAVGRGLAVRSIDEKETTNDYSWAMIQWVYYVYHKSLMDYYYYKSTFVLVLVWGVEIEYFLVVAHEVLIETIQNSFDKLKCLQVKKGMNYVVVPS